MDPQDPSSRRRLPGPGGAAPEERAGSEQARHRGLRHVRRLSNWTAVGLVAATAVTAGYFARAATSTSAQQATSVSGPQSKAPASNSKQACTTAVTAPAAVSAPVAVSGGSGVITTVPGQTTPVPSQTTPVPGQTCAPGTGSTTPPAAGYVEPHENEKGDS